MLKNFWKHDLLKAGCAVIGVMVLGWIVSPEAVFAQDSEFSKEVFNALDFVVKFVSWAWVIPATVAGKLMTNDFIYGSMFYLDRYMWQIWNFMKNMALFTLGFLFLYKIVMMFFSSKGASGFGNLLLKVALAGILIPMTWWLMAVMIDLSIVMTAAASAVPQHVMKEQRENLDDKPTSLKEVKIDGRSFSDLYNSSSEQNIKEVEFDNIVPQADSVGGTLVFLGAGILRLNDANFVGFEINGWKDLTIATLMKVGILIVFFVPLMILMIVNMMRVFYIWLWIIFSPFMILGRLFGGPMSSSDRYSQWFNMGNFFGLIFQPVVIVGLLSVGTILTIGVYDVLMAGEEYERGSLEEIHYYVNEDDSAVLGPPDFAAVKVEGELFQHLGDKVGGLFGELIMVLFVMFVLWGLVKAGFTTSKLTSTISNNLYKFSSNALKSANVMGLPSYGALEWAAKDARSAKLGFQDKVDAQADKITDKFRDFLGMEKGISAAHETSLKKSYNKGNYKDRAREFWTTMNQKVLSEVAINGSNRKFRELVNDWMVNGQGLEYLVRRNVVDGDIDELRENPAQLRQNQKFKQFVDYILTNGWDGSAYDEIREASPNIENKTYGTSSE